MTNPRALRLLAVPLWALLATSCGGDSVPTEDASVPAAESPSAAAETSGVAAPLEATDTAPIASPSGAVLEAESPAESTGDSETGASPAEATASGPLGCLPSPDEGSGPNYVAGAPERAAVGSGYALEGSVLAEGSCAPLTDALVEYWMAGPDGAYADEYRGAVRTDASGGFLIESHRPPVYAAMAAHIHLRVSAPGYEPVFLFHHPASGSDTGALAVVLGTE